MVSMNVRPILACWISSLALATCVAAGPAPASENACITQFVRGSLLGEPGPRGIFADGEGFSFTYDGRPSPAFLAGWKKVETAQPAKDGKQISSVAYTDPASGLEVACTITRFTDYPAAEWVLRLTNRGTHDTPIIEEIRPMNLGLRVPRGNVILHHSHGCDDKPTDFRPIDEIVPAGGAVRLAPLGGRSSAGSLPFFNLEWSGGGLVGAIGWSGQWALALERDSADGLRLKAGQQATHLRLHPGESIRTPSILLVAWEGADPYRGHNLLRRLLLAHYVPRRDGAIALPPVSQMSWFSWNQGNDVTETNQVASLPQMADWGVETYWLDAGWFEGGWPKGAGSWVPNPRAFPRGLRPVSDAAHRLGMQFLLWFEPERVTTVSRIAQEHPEWVLPGQKRGGLFNLGEPAARQWLTDFLSRSIHDWGIDIYRNDFNIDPLPFWQALDQPDRVGMAEIRYIEGLYQWWDDLRAQNPGLLIDNCASGGRRIDLETIRRSFPLWRNDEGGGTRSNPVLNQTLSEGLSLYVPLHASGAWELDAYSFRSVATTGVCFCMNMNARTFPAEPARRLVAELKSLRPLYLGDYYPLTEITPDETRWCAWQFNRPEIGGGFAVFFRRAHSTEASFAAELNGLDPGARYRVSLVDRGQTLFLTGFELARLRVAIDQPGQSSLVVYHRE
jgi:alpha-galactosidase